MLTEQLPKHEAVEKLAQHFIQNRSQVKVIPREDYYGEPVNKAPCYIRVIKRDTDGKKLTFLKDVPLWLAVERIVNHPNTQIELVPKALWQEYIDKKTKEDLEWNNPINQRKVRQAIEVLASQ